MYTLQSAVSTLSGALAAVQMTIRTLQAQVVQMSSDAAAAADSKIAVVGSRLDELAQSLQQAQASEVSAGQDRARQVDERFASVEARLGLLEAAAAPPAPLALPLSTSGVLEASDRELMGEGLSLEEVLSPAAAAAPAECGPAAAAGGGGKKPRPRSRAKGKVVDMEA